MGSVAKVFKKASRVIKKPLSKITKGIARGIAKVGKSVMKGVSKISNKLGPLGMIALSVAMPYALTALGGGATGGLIGRTMMQPYGAMGSTGWLNSSNVFLKSIGQVGNAIRTGYTATTGAIRTGVGNTWSTITKSIGNGFQKFSGGKGNIWTRISDGAKHLFNSARNQVNKLKKLTPKFRAGQAGKVNVLGETPWGAKYTTMTAEQAGSLIQGSAMDPANLTGQVLGSPEGWFTKAGSSGADKLITQTINDASKNNISRLTGDSLRHYNDILNHSMQNNSYINNQEIFDQVVQNKGTNYQGITDFDGVYNSDLSKTGDYKIGTTQPGQATEYTFTGEKTFDNPIGKKTINKKPSKFKKAALSLSSGLLAPSKFVAPLYEVPGMTDMTMETGTTGYSGTDLSQAMGTDFFRKVFGDNAYERIKTSYKHMNLTV